MDILALVDRIEESMDSGRSVPLMRGRLVDIEKVYEIIDEIRGNFPDELKQARWIVKERQEMLEEAEKEANRILEEARDRADSMTRVSRSARSVSAPKTTPTRCSPTSRSTSGSS
jgi:cell division septum initiation protein DivIVA